MFNLFEKKGNDILVALSLGPESGSRVEKRYVQQKRFEENVDEQNSAIFDLARNIVKRSPRRRLRRSSSIF